MRLMGFLLLLLLSFTAQSSPCRNGNDLSDILKCAEDGDPLSQDILGEIYFLGKEVPRDYEESFKWTFQAANQGEKRAQSRLGFDYYNGFGASKNHVLAYQWWSLAILGNEDPVLRKNLDDLEAEISPRELAAAQKAATRLSRKYQKK